MLRYLLSMPSCLRVFNHMLTLYHSHRFFSINWGNDMIFIFHFLLSFITLIDLQMLSHFVSLEKSLIWSWWILLYFWIWFANILLRIAYLCSLVMSAYNFLYCGVFAWFCCQHDARLIEWVQKPSFLVKYLKYFDKNSC